MKYDITYKCGHKEVRDLVGKYEDRKSKIAWLQEHCVCSDCYAKQRESELSDKFDEVVMRYAEYKRDHSDCKTKYGSYDAKDKTIIVYVPKK